MQAAILSAGLGTRLSPHFDSLPKPLVCVAGIPLIEFQLRSIVCAGFDRAVVVLRTKYRTVAEYVHSLDLSIPIEFVFKDTDGGAHSLFALSESLSDQQDFFLFSVDNIFPLKTLKEFVESRTGRTTPQVVTWVRRKTSGDSESVGVVLSADRIISIGKSVTECEYIAEGPIHCQASILEDAMVSDALQRGVTRLSDYLAHLVAHGVTMGGHLVSAVLDVDTPADLHAAELLMAR